MRSVLSTDDDPDCPAGGHRLLTELGLNQPRAGRVPALCSDAFTLLRHGRIAEGTGLLDEAIAVAGGAAGPGLEVRVRTLAAEASLALGLLDTALDHTRRGRGLAIRTHHHGPVIRSYLNEARATYLKTGDMGDALRIRGAGLRYAVAVGEPDCAEARAVRLALAEDLGEAGRWSEALDLLGPDESAESAEPAGVVEAAGAAEPAGHRTPYAVEKALVRCWLRTWYGEPAAPAPPLPPLARIGEPLRRARLLSLAMATAGRLADHAAVRELTGHALLLAEGCLMPPTSGLYLIHALASAIETQSPGGEAPGSRRPAPEAPGGRRPALTPAAVAPDQLLAVIERVYPQVRRHLTAPHELTDGVVYQARALVAAPEDPEGAVGHWDRAVAVFRRCQARARLVPALLGRAALAGPGDPWTARLLDEAERIATELRAARHLERVAELRTAGPRAVPGPVVRLTARQLEVVALLADGRTDREIAGELRLSVRTVNAHVVQILTRLDVRNRAGAAAWYYRQGPARGGSPRESG